MALSDSPYWCHTTWKQSSGIFGLSSVATRSKSNYQCVIGGNLDVLRLKVCHNPILVRLFCHTSTIYNICLNQYQNGYIFNWTTQPAKIKTDVSYHFYLYWWSLECSKRYNALLQLNANLQHVGLQIELGFLMVGHTHEDIDALFGNIGKWLKKNNALTVTGK